MVFFRADLGLESPSYIFLSSEYFQPEHQTEEHPTHAKTRRMVVWAVGILMWCLALPAGGAEFVCQSSQIPPDTVYY